jgi:hypothetical protein
MKSAGPASDLGLQFCHSGLSGIFRYFQEGFPTSWNVVLARPSTMAHALMKSVRQMENMSGTLRRPLPEEGLSFLTPSG